MEFENRFRFRLVFLAATLICLSATVTFPFLPTFVKSGALHFGTADLANIFHVPPLKFFPIIVLSAAFVSFGSAYLNARRLEHRILSIVDDIEGFRLQCDEKRPIFIKHPNTGKINAYQVTAVLDYQKREHAGYLSRFRHSLDKLAHDIAIYGLSTERDLTAEFFGMQDVLSVEKRLCILADQIGQSSRLISWHAAKIALSLVALPTIVWAIGNLAGYMKF